MKHLPSTFTKTATCFVPLAFLTVNMYFPVSFLSQNLMIATACLLVYCKEIFSEWSNSLSPFDQKTFGSGFPPIDASRTRSDPALIVTISPCNLASSSALGGAVKRKETNIVNFLKPYMLYLILNPYESVLQYSSLQVTAPVDSEPLLITPAAFFARTRNSYSSPSPRAVTVKKFSETIV